MIAIVTDSTADIPDDLRELHAIHVVPLRVQFGEQTFRDGVDLSKDEFYTRLLRSDVLPTTSTPPSAHFWSSTGAYLTTPIRSFRCTFQAS